MDIPPWSVRLRCIHGGNVLSELTDDGANNENFNLLKAQIVN
jgi:hypothetical protein